MDPHSPSGPACVDALALRWLPFPTRIHLVGGAGTCGTGCRTGTSRSFSAERGIEVDHVTLYRWVQRFTPLLLDAARLCRHLAGDRWFVDETYVKVSGVGPTSTGQSTSRAR